MELNTETVKKIRGLILFAVAAVVVGVNYRSVLEGVRLVFRMLFPFILGAVIAFILNVPMSFLEPHIPVKKETIRRALGLLLTIFFVVGILLLVIFVVTPQLLDTVRSLQRSIPQFLTEATQVLEKTFADYPEILAMIESVQIDWPQLLADVMEFLRSGAGVVLSGTISAARSIVNGVTSFGIGFIFAIYILLQKETLGRQSRKLVLAFLPERAAGSIFRTAALTQRIFSSFLTGQCVEAVILGMMFFGTLILLRLPYSLLIGVLIAFTALIPIFGAFIGLVVGAFLMLMNNPVDALVFVIAFFILQQVEGNLIYPHVVGGSVGLPSIWVLVAVTIGGSAFGIAGMLVFIPLCSVLYTLLKEEVNRRLEQKAAGRRAAQGTGKEAAGKAEPGRGRGTAGKTAR